jgi:hypothetical protein
MPTDPTDFVAFEGAAIQRIERFMRVAVMRSLLREGK